MKDNPVCSARFPEPIPLAIGLRISQGSLSNWVTSGGITVYRKKISLCCRARPRVDEQAEIREGSGRERRRRN